MLSNNLHTGQPSPSGKIIPDAVNFVPPDLAPSAASTSQTDYVKSEQHCATAIFQKYYDMPMYQRPYSWTLKNVDDLLGDLLNGYATQSELFLGALVMFDGAVPGHYWVVDGQQRLTTFVMVLAFGMHWARSKGKSFDDLFGELSNMLWQPKRAMAKMPARYEAGIWKSCAPDCNTSITQLSKTWSKLMCVHLAELQAMSEASNLTASCPRAIMQMAMSHGMLLQAICPFPCCFWKIVLTPMT